MGLDVDFDGFWFAFWSIFGGVWDCINSVIVWELLQKPRFQHREILMPKLSILVVGGNMPEALVSRYWPSRAKKSCYFAVLLSCCLESCCLAVLW